MYFEIIKNVFLKQTFNIFLCYLDIFFPKLNILLAVKDIFISNL